MIKPTNTIQRKALSGAFLPALAVTALLATTQFVSASPATDRAALQASRDQMQDADIEQVSSIAYSTAQQIGNDTIKLTGKNVKTLTVDATRSILAKVASAPSPVGSLSFDNAADEIVESAAFILDGIAGNSKLTKLGAQKAVVLTIFKAVIRTSKNSNGLFGNDALGNPIAFLRDLAGSIALTLRSETAFGSTTNPTQFAKLVSFLDKKSKSLAGPANDTQIQTGLDEGFSSTDNGKYENGNNPSLLVADPETDLRNA
jgi:hypothetical protein